jgi:invasion protein IalB
LNSLLTRLLVGASTASVVLLSAPLPASAQDTEGLGTIIQPLVPKRQVGLPNQAPHDGGGIAVPPKRAGSSASKEGAAAGKTAAAADDGSDQAYGDWTLQCLGAGASGIPCQVMHRSLSPDKKQVIVVMSMAYFPKGEVTKLQLALPLGFSVQDGVKLDFGEGYSTTAKVSRCTAQGCLVEGNGAPEMIAAMRKGKAATVTVRTVEGSEIKLPFSLAGFAEAYDAMKSKNQAKSPS